MIVVIHTVPLIVRMFEALCGELLPGVVVKHILDEPVLEAIRRRGRLDAADAARIAEHVRAAEAIGAEAVLVSCSTLSPVVSGIEARIPVVTIDAAMIEAAVRQGTRIGVLATISTTLEPTRGMLAAEAARSGKTADIELLFVENAFAALLAGDTATHDRLLSAAALELAPRSDVIVLAQASMARTVESLPPLPCPVLSSPQLALSRVKEILAAADHTA